MMMFDDTVRLAGRIQTRLSYGETKDEIATALVETEGLDSEDVFIAFAAAEVLYEEN